MAKMPRRPRMAFLSWQRLFETLPALDMPREARIGGLVSPGKGGVSPVGLLPGVAHILQTRKR